MDSAPPPMIHEVLPPEIMGVIFEEHAKLEWRAPAIDGRVCRIWRQIVLNTPQAWAYLDVVDDDNKSSSTADLRLWLGRSGAAPLHIRVNKPCTLGETINRVLYDLIGDYHARIAFLRLPQGGPSFFEGRDFPRLQRLDIGHWYQPGSPFRTLQWDSMPNLRSLRLNVNTPKRFQLPWSELTLLKVLVLCRVMFTSLPRHSQSLTTLMLDGVSVGDVVSGPMAFPSLTYLSLFNVIGLKSHINTPCLATYHEGGVNVRESFSGPVPTVVEYGVFGLLPSELDCTKWNYFFPNVLQLSIRAGPRVFILLLRSLSSHPHTLPMLQAISAGTTYASFTKEDRKAMTSLVRVRSEACHIEFALFFETPPTFQIPIFFGESPDSPH